jgi:hypothetical protein
MMQVPGMPFWPESGEHKADRNPQWDFEEPVNRD